METVEKAIWTKPLKAALAALCALCLLLASAAAAPTAAQAATKAPGKVTGLKAVLGVDCACHTHFDWKKIKGADKYQIAYKWRAKDAWKYKTVKGTDYGLNARLSKYKKKSDNPKLQFKVRAVKGSKKGAWSATATSYWKPHWYGKTVGWC